MKYCSVEDCNNQHNSKGYCSKHYYRFKKYGDPNQRIERSNCRVDNCNEIANAKELCPKHYYRNKTYGDPNIVRFPWREDRSCSIPYCQFEHEAKGYCKKHYIILKKIDISHEDYVKKTTEQNGKCMICKNECSHGKTLSLDHDHESGQIRDLLCAPCNLALGGFKDSPILLRSALKYLKKWGKE
jgi:hypothetical protein